MYQLLLFSCQVSVWLLKSHDSSVHRIFQARILEWVAISSSRGSSQPRDWTCVSCVSCIGRQILYHCATWGALLFVWWSSNAPCFMLQWEKAMISGSSPQKWIWRLPSFLWFEEEVQLASVCSGLRLVTTGPPLSVSDKSPFDSMAC